MWNVFLPSSSSLLSLLLSLCLITLTKSHWQPAAARRQRILRIFAASCGSCSPSFGFHFHFHFVCLVYPHKVNMKIVCCASFQYLGILVLCLHHIIITFNLMIFCSHTQKPQKLFLYVCFSFITISFDFYPDFELSQICQFSFGMSICLCFYFILQSVVVAYISFNVSLSKKNMNNLFVWNSEFQCST